MGAESLVDVPLDDDRWLAFVRARPEATVFHHPSWALLLSECYGLNCFALGLRDPSGGLCGGIPVLEAARVPGRGVRWISLPFTDAISPLVDSAQEALLAAELDALRRDRGVRRVELRGSLEGATPTPAWAVRHELVLDPDPEVTAARFAPSVARTVRGAERQGVVVRRAESARDLADTYYELHAATRKRLGVPTQPRRFFRLLWERVLDRGLGFALLAYNGVTPIAGMVVLGWNDTAVYKYAASDREAWRLRPNNALVAEAIRMVCVEGFRRFDFGRSELTAEGLRRFKQGWGAVEQPLVYSSLGEPLSPPLGSGLAGQVLRRAPIWATRLLGQLLYRYAA